jgi:hypothetical protein
MWWELRRRPRRRRRRRPFWWVPASEQRRIGSMRWWAGLAWENREDEDRPSKFQICSPDASLHVYLYNATH